MTMYGVSRFIAILTLAGALDATSALAQSAGGTMAPVQNAPARMAAHPSPLSKSLEFPTEAAAAAHCPGGTVVWSSLSKGRSFHASGSRYFGKTRHGAYVCKDDALAAGFHQAKS